MFANLDILATCSLLLVTVFADKTLKLWEKDGPSEDDVIQIKTDDCFLEAVLAAVARVDKQTMMAVYSDYATQNLATVKLFDKNLVEHEYPLNLVQVSKNTVNSAKAVWVAAFQSAYYDLEPLNGSPDGVWSTNGGDPNLVVKSIYGSKADAYTDVCTEAVLKDLGGKADKWPVIFNTNHQTGDLPQGHSLTLHNANDTHVVMRNPWSALGNPTSTAKGIQDLGHGTFAMTIEDAMPQCLSITVADFSKPGTAANANVAALASLASVGGESNLNLSRLC